MMQSINAEPFYVISPYKFKQITHAIQSVIYDMIMKVEKRYLHPKPKVLGTRPLKRSWNPPPSMKATLLKIEIGRCKTRFFLIQGFLVQNVAKYLREWQGFSHLIFKWYVTSIIIFIKQNKGNQKVRPAQENDIKLTSLSC